MKYTSLWMFMIDTFFISFIFFLSVCLSVCPVCLSVCPLSLSLSLALSLSLSRSLSRTHTPYLSTHTYIYNALTYMMMFDKEDYI